MTAWALKRFWQQACATEIEGGFGVALDTRVVKTPAKSGLVLPTRAMAEAIAAEWDAQQKEIQPDTMPLTKAANSAIDKVAMTQDAVVDEIAGFGGTDLLCYRADQPEELVARQAAAWDPLLAWAEERFGVAFIVTSGIMPVDQPVATVERLRAEVASMDAFRLAALHDLVAISGSLIIGLAVAYGRLDVDEAYEISRIDEAFQIEQWGEIEEALEHIAKRARGFRSAARFYGLCG